MSAKLDQLVKQISYNAKNRISLFREQPFSVQVGAFKQLSAYVKKELIKQLENAEIVALLEKFDPDEVTAVLQLCSKKRQAKLVAELTAQMQADVSMLLDFEPNTAAQLVNLNYVFVAHDQTVATVAEKVKNHEKRTGKHPTILVLDQQVLLGILPGSSLALSKPHELVTSYVKKVPTLKYSTSQKKVVRFFKRNPHSQAVVLGKNDNVLGIIYSDDIIRLLNEQDSASLYDFAGLDREESIYDSPKRKINFRYRWLLLNLVTSFLAASTVGLFEDVIAKEVLLAVYMPIVAGMGGNSGTQTLAVMVRGLAFHDLTWVEIGRTLMSEVAAGFFNGLLNGLIVFAIVTFIQQNLLVGIVLGVAMVTNLVIAATFGTLVPVVVSKLGKDPASSATIFITTATDVFGFLAFLGLAAFLLM